MEIKQNKLKETLAELEKKAEQVGIRSFKLEQELGLDVKVKVENGIRTEIALQIET